MAHPRGLRVAILLFFLLAGAALAAGDQIANLENKVSKIEAMLKEEPAELRPMILRELAAARRELLQALQERFDLLSQMAVTTAEEQKAKSERLEKLRSRMDELNRQLAADTSAPRSGAAPAGVAAAVPVFEFAEAPKLPKTVKLRVDISREWKDPHAQNKCSNRPFSHSAKVWKLVVIADPVWEDKEKEKKSKRYFSDEKQNLLIPVATLKDNPKLALVVGGRVYEGRAERYVREVRLVFENLSVAEMSDLADHLANHADEIQRAYSAAVARYEIFQVAFAHDPKDSVAEGALYNVLTCNLDPVDQPDAFHQLLVSAQQGIQLHVCMERRDAEQPRAPGAAVHVKALAPFDLTARMQSAQLDAASIQETKRMVAVLINTQAEKWSSDAGEQKKISDDVAAKKMAATSSAVQPPSLPPLVIDEPCFHLSIAPLLSGNEFKPVASFRYRYDYYTADDKIAIKLRAEGEGAEGGQYFQRMKIGGEGTGLLVRGENGWQVAGGVVGHYSFTRNNGKQVDEWQAGGKFQVQAPFIRLFETRAGSDARPTFIVESAATGGNGSTTKTTDFGLTTSFRYTLRPNARVALDMKADGGWSHRPRFANEKTYSYFSIQGRYYLEASWDFMVRYECGRKEPDYRNFCGWQTGLVLVTGR